MAYLIAPYSDSMQLGQGFNSFTQEIQDENAVSFDRLRADASPAQPYFPEAISQAEQGDAYECGSEASMLTSATPTSSQWNQTRAAPNVIDNGSGLAPVFRKDRKSPIVTFTSRFVDNFSEVATEMNISPAVPIMRQSRSGSDAGLPFDTRHFYEADLNYYLGVRVLTRQNRPAAAFAGAQALTNRSSDSSNIGDCFISGFLEGGQLHALISVQLKDKKRRAEVSECLEAVLKISTGKFTPLSGTVEAAMCTIMEHSRINVEVSNVGGGTITLHDQSSILQSLRDVASNFPDLAANKPETIFAILTKYDSLGHLQALKSVPCFDNTSFYANTLLDAFGEFRSIERRLSTQITQLKSGTVQFHHEESLATEHKRRFDASWRGITRAKRECTGQLLKIVKEVDEIRWNPGVATDDTRDEQFEDPLVFSQYLPRVAPTAEAAAEEDPHATQAQLYHPGDEILFLDERKKVEELSAEHPDFAKQFRLAVLCGTDCFGQTFCSLDYLKPGWVLAEITANVAKGIVTALTLRYANSLVTVFGTISRSDKTFNLKLDLGAKERIVGCSIETGRTPSKKARDVVTAVLLSTNRGSALVGQPADWKEGVEGLSLRSGVAFEDLKMTHYDPLLTSGPPPMILTGFRKMDTWSGGNIRFSATVDFVTKDEFSIGVDQWSNSLFYGGEFSWIGIRPDTPGIQAGRFEARGSVKRDVKFAKPFTKQPQVMTWISGLDLDIKISKRVDVHATNIDKTGFTMNVGSADSALAQASISWIAMSEDSGCIISSYGFQDDPEDCVDKVDESTRRFPEGKFSKPPKVLAGFTAFDISGSSENPRFGTFVWDVTADQFAWNIYAWGGSSISSARVHWIAIPAE
ncbi:hypothetical protein UCDDS831_g08854 [Diplodia seriata]|uniref:H-type lectin domain-containing protein n=1 Tax=Diplodia seriata TaxID=420778 RepID=A0A0G2DRI5_9PEZI|nr:hypothetical protein UCDDS831_g08854 [Diplodia seriata]